MKSNEQQQSKAFVVDTFPSNKPKGVYLYGGVGTGNYFFKNDLFNKYLGKTMIMDLFLESIADNKRRKNTNRVHFNSFMLDVHQSRFFFQTILIW